MYKYKLITVTLMVVVVSACSNESSLNTTINKNEKASSSSSTTETVVDAILPSAHAGDYLPLSIKTGGFKLGKPASKEEIAGWHIEVGHGHNLPPGEGTAAGGEELYETECASCHGSFGEGVGRNPVLAGGEGTLTDKQKPERTVGSYWPYASTLLDYTHRAMPFHAAQSLSWDETWSLSAYVLYLNDVIKDEDFVFNAQSYYEIHMPNENGFIFKDKKPDTNNTRCMKDCKDQKKINIRTALLGYGSGAEDVVAETAIVKGHELGQKVYDATCRLCHATGLAGAPKTEDNLVWETILKQGINKVHKHAIDGYTGQNGVMPPKGGNMELTDGEVIAAVDFMVKDAK